MSYEDSISPEFYELERAAIFKRAWLNVGRVEQLPRKGSYFTKELKVANTSIIVVRTARGEVKAFHNICRHRGNKLVWNDMPLEETSGICRQFTCKYHAWRYDLDGNLTFVQQEGEFFDLDKSRYGLVPVHCDVWEGFIFVNFAEEPEQSLREFLGPMVTRLGGISVRADDIAVVLPLGGQGELEALHGRVPGVLSRTRVAREPVADEVLEGGGRGRLRGAALSDRRSAPAGQHVGHPGLGDGLRDAQADGGHLPERACSGRGTEPDLGPHAAGRQPGQVRPVGPGLVPAVPELRDPDLGAGLVPDLPLLADVLQHPHLRGHAVLPAAAQRRVSASRRSWRRCTFKEFGLQDANTLEATQTMVESRAVDGFLLNDQEVLMRHLHNETAAWVDDYQQHGGGSVTR